MVRKENEMAPNHQTVVDAMKNSISHTHKSHSLKHVILLSVGNHDLY